MKIERITTRRLELPLSVPYKLSLGSIQSFDTVLIEMLGADGQVGYGEATVLHGYTEETIEQVWREACVTAQRLIGLDTEAAKEAVTPLHAQAPFTSTALVTAIEMLDGHPLFDVPKDGAVPLLAVVNQEGGEALQQEIDKLLTAGYQTLKVKIGFEVAADLARVKRIQQAVAGRGRVRLDANQGYSLEEGCRFVGEVDPEGIELVEQTCAAGDWEAAAAVARTAEVPMMLDESIYGISDVEKAAELCCASYIKFKLMKAGGLEALVQALKHIRALGMEPILGNGVASDIGCWMEACIAYRQINNAGEMNGFLKPRQRLLCHDLEVVGGRLVLPAEYPLLCPKALAAVTAAEAAF